MENRHLISATCKSSRALQSSRTSDLAVADGKRERSIRLIGEADRLVHVDRIPVVDEANVPLLCEDGRVDLLRRGVEPIAGHCQLQDGAQAWVADGHTPLRLPALTDPFRFLRYRDVFWSATALILTSP